MISQIINLNLVLSSSTEAILTIFRRLHVLLNPVSVVRDSHKLGPGFGLRLIITVESVSRQLGCLYFYCLPSYAT